MNKIIRNIIVIGMITIIVALSLMLIGRQITANAIKEKQKLQAYEDWLVENCTCLAKERIMCPDGFELKGNWCFNNSKNYFTNILKACSQYNCSGEIKLYNNQTQKWEN